MTKERSYLAFDLETTTAFRAEANWKTCRPLGVACAVTQASDAKRPVLWHSGSKSAPERQMSRRDLKRLVRHLIAEVRSGYTLISWNGLGFDFDILAEESGMLAECKRLALNHVDMMFQALCQLGYGIRLDSAAKGMRIPTKPSGVTGALIPQMWNDGKSNEVFDYAAHDARIILELGEQCAAKGYLRWITRRRIPRKIRLPSGWLPVNAARELPEPHPSQALRKWGRTNFTGWLSSIAD